MEAIPQGTVTFLFTDLEGSTALWEQHPGAMHAALPAHDQILRTGIEAHGGYVFATAGDGFAAAFWTPADALGAVIDAQRRLAEMEWPKPVVLRVRMGLHTGAAEERDGDYFGSAVNRAARIMGAAHGGQVLVSVATAELVRDRLPGGAVLIDLGEHALMGFGRPDRLFQVSWLGAAARFPPLRTTSPALGNLPTPPTSFVGRAQELQRLGAELRARRLITLTGAGGVGKTRLAIEAAWSVTDDFPDGVWLCELAPAADPGAVGHAVATALAVRPQECLSIADSVVDALRGRRLLLLLDNCEHVLEAAADLVTRITGSCPTVAVLVTSREPLGAESERVWLVASLPPGGEAVELFCQRAADADSTFAPTPDDLPVIASICHRLDGIPLAIELAAARVRSLTVGDLAARLDDRFQLLRSQRRTTERHQTLRATMQWSYQLLNADERVLFDRLSVFAGGFDLAAAETVCVGDDVEISDVGDVLIDLVEKSMVVADRSGLSVRYRLLETLRQYGQEHLADAGETEALRNAHLAHYLLVARTAGRHYGSDAQPLGAATMRAEWANFRAAVHWALACRDQTAASSLVEALFFFAWNELRDELRDWANDIIANGPQFPGPYGAAALFSTLRGEHDHALRLIDAGCRWARSADDPATWGCWFAKTLAYEFSGEVEQALAASRTLCHVIDPSQPPYASAAATALSASIAAIRGDPSSARPLLAAAQNAAAPLHNSALDAYIVAIAGIVESFAGRYELARDHFRRGQTLAERSGHLYLQTMIPLSLALLDARTRTDPHAADAALLDAVAIPYRSRNWFDTLTAVEGLALHWLRTDRIEAAATVLGHLQVHDIHHMMFVKQRRRALETLAQIPQADRWMAEGAGLDRDELIDYLTKQKPEPV